jgi:hypothetical protein
MFVKKSDNKKVQFVKKIDAYNAKFIDERGKEIVLNISEVDFCPNIRRNDVRNLK